MILYSPFGEKVSVLYWIVRNFGSELYVQSLRKNLVFFYKCPQLGRCQCEHALVPWWTCLEIFEIVFGKKREFVEFRMIELMTCWLHAHITLASCASLIYCKVVSDIVSLVLTLVLSNLLNDWIIDLDCQWIRSISLGPRLYHRLPTHSQMGTLGGN